MTSNETPAPQSVLEMKGNPANAALASGIVYVDKSAVRVEISTVSETDVRFYPCGGGFERRLGVEKFRERFRAEHVAPAYFAVQVQIDDGDVFWAYANSDRWNGWVMPFFTVDVAHQVAKAMQGKYEPETASFVFQDPGTDWEDRFEAADIVFEGKSLKVFPIGAGSWCWSIAE